MKQKLDTKDEETERLSNQLTTATKNSMRLEEINGRLFSELTGIKERRGKSTHRVTQTYSNTNEMGVQCAIGGNQVNAA